MVVCMRPPSQPWIHSNALPNQIQATSMLKLIRTTEKQYCTLELNITTVLAELIKSLDIHRIKMFLTLFVNIYKRFVWCNFHTLISIILIFVIFDRFTQCTWIARQKQNCKNTELQGKKNGPKNKRHIRFIRHIYPSCWMRMKKGNNSLLYILFKQIIWLF